SGAGPELSPADEEVGEGHPHVWAE
ncbi:uncharacterized, partial [Tachysurus ichikawai]